MNTVGLWVGMIGDPTGGLKFVDYIIRLSFVHRHSSMWKIDIERRDIQEFVDFILKYDELALAHPNQAAASSTFPGFPEHWISWSKSRHCGWNEIMKVYTNTSIEIINVRLATSALSFELRIGPQAQLSQGIPEDLCEFIRKARLLQLPRSPSFQPHLSPPKHVLGVTPKKLHEVFTMSTYIAHLFAERVPKPYIVDLGAGQVHIIYYAFWLSE